MRGRIIKGIAGFYYVYVEDRGVYECKAKGIFRNRGLKPLVGDFVEIQALKEEDHSGNIEEILPRSSELVRPAVANLTQALIVFALSKPKPNLGLLDRFLVMMRQKGLPSIICFNKLDEAEEDQEELRRIYAGSGSALVFVSAKTGAGSEELKGMLLEQTTALAGPSGVGKSTLTNLLIPEAESETGQISEKLERGKHTTRHSELFRIQKDSYLFDTPGFSSLDLMETKKEELRYDFPEFAPYENKCRFPGCAHAREPDCAVKAAVEAGNIHRRRYDSYLDFYEELCEREKRRYH
ncbi:MAG: ribosome small subunit-dependent GTPase A [Lachnospiraceae bacterium]|nr:ribosome small subunit-dependent GTPase A [Lachnospiraceae bacterium]